MRTSPSLRRCVILVALAGWFAGCGRSVSEPTSIPGLAAHTGVFDPTFRAFHLQAFQMQHIWAGGGQGADGADYRVKLAVWDYGQDNPLVAEFYFHDADRFDPTGRHRNPDPTQAKPPFQIHFPMSTLAPMLDPLRTANERVYLYYAHGEWAVGVIRPEGIGSG